MLAVKTQSVPALERGLAILECLTRSQHGLTVSQLTRNLGFPKSSVHALLLTFERHGYLYRDGTSGRYRLGLRICDLANIALARIKLRDQAAPLLSRLRDSTSLTAHMAILEHDEALLVEKMESPKMHVNSWIGKRMDLHCTALGKALIAYLPDEQVETLVQRRGMLRHNENTIVSMRRLKEDLDLVRRRGYSVDDEEEEINVRCIGAPIRDSQGRVLAAISITGTLAEVNENSRDSLIANVRATATAIARRLEQSEVAAAQ